MCGKFFYNYSVGVDKNLSNIHRRTLYYTYSRGLKGSQYNKYFLDKKNSTNKTSKTLEGRV